MFWSNEEVPLAGKLPEKIAVVLDGWHPTTGSWLGYEPTSRLTTGISF